MINSEEDAENAFQLSSALTQALLDFRMKSLDSVSSSGLQKCNSRYVSRVSCLWFANAK